MKNELITALENKGFKRWTKGTMDRLYINPTCIGLELEYYKTGNVSDAYLNGERISNTRGREMKAAKCYIDIATGKCVSSYDVFVEAMEQILAETEAELEPKTETAEATEQSEATHFYIRILTYGTSTPHIIDEETLHQAELGNSYLNPDDFMHLCEAHTMEEAIEYHDEERSRAMNDMYAERLHP